MAVVKQIMMLPWRAFRSGVLSDVLPGAQFSIAWSHMQGGAGPEQGIPTSLQACTCAGDASL